MLVTSTIGDIDFTFFFTWQKSWRNSYEHWEFTVVVW